MLRVGPAFDIQISQKKEDATRRLDLIATVTGTSSGYYVHASCEARGLSWWHSHAIFGFVCSGGLLVLETKTFLSVSCAGLVSCTRGRRREKGIFACCSAVQRCEIGSCSAGRSDPINFAGGCLLCPKLNQGRWDRDPLCSSTFFFFLLLVFSLSSWRNNSRERERESRGQILIRLRLVL